MAREFFGRAVCSMLLAATLAMPAVADGPGPKPVLSPTPTVTSEGTIPAPSNAEVPPNPMVTNPNRPELMLKNADQINLLNQLAMTDISSWAALLKRNRSAVNREFVEVLARRGHDALARAVALAQRDKNSQNKVGELVDACFRYALLADLAAKEIDEPRVHMLTLARRFSDAGRYDMAIGVVNNVLLMEKDNLDALELAAELNFKLRNYFPSLRDFERVVKRKPSSDNAWAHIGQISLLMGDVTRARQAMERALEINSSNALAKDLEQRLRNPAQVSPAGTTATVTRASNPAEVARDLAMQAQVKRREGFHAQAEKLLQEAIGLDPKCVDAWMAMGDLSFQTSNFIKAVEYYNQAATYAPSEAEPMRYLALALEKVYDQSGSVPHLDRAIEAVQRAIQLKQDYATARLDRDRLVDKKTRSIQGQGGR